MKEDVIDPAEEEIESSKERVISFRVSEKEYERIEEAARKRNEKPNVWSRNVVLSESGKGLSMTWVDRQIYEELARVRFLLGSGFDLLSAGKLSQSEWLQLLGKAEKNPAAIADTLLKTRERNR